MTNAWVVIHTPAERFKALLVGLFGPHSIVASHHFRIGKT